MSACETLVDLIKFATRACIKRYRSGTKHEKRTAPAPLAQQSRTSSLYSNRVSFIQRAEASTNRRRSVFGQVKANENDLRR